MELDMFILVMVSDFEGDGSVSKEKVKTIFFRTFQ